jgi:hypothetical protein
MKIQMHLARARDWVVKRPASRRVLQSVGQTRHRHGGGNDSCLDKISAVDGYGHWLILLTGNAESVNFLGLFGRSCMHLAGISILLVQRRKNTPLSARLATFFAFVLTAKTVLSPQVLCPAPKAMT